jgi:hypothetical protein
MYKLESRVLKLKQKGGALLLMTFIIGLAAAAYVLAILNVSSFQTGQDKKTHQALKDAKTALIAWAVMHPSVPGLMPYPDRNADPNGYDGLSDCPGGATNFSHLIGRLPWKSGDYNDCNTLLSGLGNQFMDGNNEALWYAVSKNIVHIYSPSGDPVINPSIIDNPPYGSWIHVYDKNGLLVSDKVAALIFAPGPVLNDQDRSSGVADATNYLDTFELQAGGGAKSNRTYSSADEDFYIGEDSRGVRLDNPLYQHPYYFNDKLVYITINELIDALSKRAAAEAKSQLINYKNSTAITSPPGYYPNASALVSGEYYQRYFQYGGFLPIQQPLQTTSKVCSVSYTSANASSAVCDFLSITNVEFTRSSGTFSGETGACTRTNSNKTCRCGNVVSGTNRCTSGGGRRFTCTSNGCSTSGVLPGSYVFNGVFKFATNPTSVKINNSSGACSGCGTNSATCSYVTATPSGNFAYDVTTAPAPFNSVATNSILPAWFTSNIWQDYLYYSVSSSCVYGQLCDVPDINIGGKSSIQAMIAATGAPIVSAAKGSLQTHSSCDVKEYLDSAENTDLDVTFEASNKLKANNYNDQIFVVAP